MPNINRSALVPYSAAQMYALVNQVEHYPEFVPWCVASDSSMLTENEQRASLNFSKGAVRTAFTTLNTLTEGARVDMQLVDGPFKQLQGCWRFEDIADSGSSVSLELQFELSNRMLKFALEGLFKQITDRLVMAFVARAGVVYGGAE